MGLLLCEVVLLTSALCLLSRAFCLAVFLLQSPLLQCNIPVSATP